MKSAMIFHHYCEIIVYLYENKELIDEHCCYYARHGLNSIRCLPDTGQYERWGGLIRKYLI